MKFTKTAYFYLDDKELARLDKKVKASGLNRSQYIRKCLDEAQMPPCPKIDVPMYIIKLSETAEKAKLVADKLWHKICFDVPLLKQAADETIELMLNLQRDILKAKERINCEKETTELLSD